MDLRLPDSGSVFFRTTPPVYTMSDVLLVLSLSLRSLFLSPTSFCPSSDSVFYFILLPRSLTGPSVSLLPID